MADRQRHANPIRDLDQAALRVVALLSTSGDGNVTTVDMTYRVTLVQSEEGFAVWCDDLPGCNSQGQTREEALTNIKSAISEYVAAQPEIEERFNVRIEREEVTV
jgi:predicted RNase H-like HicB family nuclease